MIYFDSFRVGHILKETSKFIRKKNIITKIYKIQAKGKRFLDYTHFFV